MRSYPTRQINVVVLLFFLLVVGGIALLRGPIVRPSMQVISPLAEEVPATNSLRVLFAQKPKDTSELIQQIKEMVEKQQGIYSVYIFDINENRGFGINETTIFTAASVNKLPILAALYYEAQREKIDLDRRITIQQKDIQDYGTGSIRYEGPGGVYSIKSLAQIMIEKSDNTAAYVLTNVIGESLIQDLVGTWGLTQTDIKNNKTSNKDLAILLTKMYKGGIANEALTTEMIGFMDNSDFENRLPRLLPKETKVYHKIGNEIGNTHDVGIVAHPKYPYYIGILTNDVVNEVETEEVIAQISKLTYDFTVREL